MTRFLLKSIRQAIAAVIFSYPGLNLTHLWTAQPMIIRETDITFKCRNISDILFCWPSYSTVKVNNVCRKSKDTRLSFSPLSQPLWNERKLYFLLWNKTCSPCLHSLVETEANVYKNSRADLWEPLRQSRVVTCSRILINFAEVFTRLWR